MALPDQKLTPTTTEVVESQEVVIKSSAVSIESREPKGPTKIKIKATSGPNRKGASNQRSGALPGRESCNQVLETNQCPKQEELVPEYLENLNCQTPDRFREAKLPARVREVKLHEGEPEVVVNCNEQ
jgi:hypothetical protein